MENDIQIETTADGSYTLFLPQLNEHYHSINGAVQESLHIFIQSGLRHSSVQNLSILEIGFGTGLNAYLTLLEVLDTTRKITYTTFELYPLPLNIIQQLNYPEQVSLKTADLFIKLHDSLWSELINITDTFSIKKINADFTVLDNFSVHKGNTGYDLIYFDAFAPDKQGDMWTRAIFDYLYKQTNPNGILVTYCAKGIVRRMMQQSGYIVERLPGPPGKREMLRATKV